MNLFHSIYNVATGETTNVPFTQEEIDEYIRENAELEKLAYAKYRAITYPSIVDQLDLLYHVGYEGWKAEIQKVKDQFPKPDISANSNNNLV